ncbi:MAG: phosphoenolpyruvate--protein phosphotransferase [Elusimicrobia bacterium]|nr:phosphoenolpyruvate--protein phosphotransferase [Elusimicrobiota bacterium]
MIIIKGVPASPGIAIGRAYVLEDEEIVVSRQEISPERVRSEVKRFKQALERTHLDLDAAEARVLRTLGKEHAKLIDAHRLILKDPLITKEVTQRILQERVNAEFALSETLERVNQAFEKIEDEFFRDRRHDLFDVGKRLLEHLLRKERKPLSALREPAILIARNLLPSDTLHLREARVLGFATDLGGKTSHTALLAQSLEIPAVVGLSDASHQVKPGDMVILDGNQGLVIISPGPEALQRYEKAQVKEKKEERALEVLRGLPCETADGKRVELLANLDTLEDARTIGALQPDGIGLFRTEFLYLNRTSAPEEEEQVEVYSRVVESLSSLPVIIRTADIGGDRLSDLGLEGPKEETNPFMGLRGIRLFLRYPELFKTQLRAILRAAIKGRVKILLPMVSSVGELKSARRLLTQAQAELVQEGHVFESPVEMGMMVEIPAAILLLDFMLEEIDFVSLGTNDLIQYLLAVDRVNEHVSHLYDPFHPAVLRVLHMTVEAVHKKGRWVSVCGEMASDPRAVPLLLGVGVDAFSVSPRMFLKIKQTLRTLKAAEVQSLFQRALVQPTSEEVHRLLDER